MKCWVCKGFIAQDSFFHSGLKGDRHNECDDRTEPIVTKRAMRRQLARDNAKQPERLVEVPPDLWPSAGPTGLIQVFRSRDFLVQVYASDKPDLYHCRLSVNRTKMTGHQWTDNISWDDLQRLKRECGYGDWDAVEVYPADEDVVAIAHIRHLWIFIGRIPLAWRKRK